MGGASRLMNFLLALDRQLAAELAAHLDITVHHRLYSYSGQRKTFSVRSKQPSYLF